MESVWLYAYFPYLSIEAINNTLPHINWDKENKVENTTNAMRHSVVEHLPLVIADGSELRPMVYAMNLSARECGVKFGMTIASAKVLQHDLIVIPRSKAKELRTLKRIANALLQFTPSVTIESDTDRAGIALEISGSLTFFGGLDSLLNQVQTCVRRLHYEARFGIAPNPLAASILARTVHQSKDKSEVLRCLSIDALKEQLSPISVQHFAWSNDVFRSLHLLGLVTLGDVLRQPYAGLQKRFGGEFVLDLDRALGLVNDIREFYTPPETFQSSLDFLFEVKNVDQLLFLIEELLVELEGFLRARGAGVMSIQIELRQGRTRSQRFEFHTRAPVRSASHWLRLVSDRIETCALESPVIEIALFAHQILSLHQESESLLPQEKGTNSDWFTLLDRLASRLGEKNVYRIAIFDDHRPELAWQSDSDDRLKLKQQSRSQKLRPTWLLHEPKSLVEIDDYPQHNGALTLLAGPERIDTGWWDNKPVARDYFVSINPQQEVCWIFRDYRQGKRWYLHGFFA